MLHCLCSFQLNRWRIRQRCPLLRERSYCRGRCSQCEVRAAAKCQLCLPNPPPTASKSVQQKIKEYKERSKLFTVFQWDKCYPGWQVQQNTERNQQNECLIGWVQLTSGRLCFTWGARLPLIGVRWAVQLWCAHIEKQGFLEVVHHSQTVTVSKHHTERQKGQRMQWNSKLWFRQALFTFALGWKCLVTVCFETGYNYDFFTHTNWAQKRIPSYED